MLFLVNFQSISNMLPNLYLIDQSLRTVRTLTPVESAALREVSEGVSLAERKHQAVYSALLTEMNSAVPHRWVTCPCRGGLEDTNFAKRPLINSRLVPKTDTKEARVVGLSMEKGFREKHSYNCNYHYQDLETKEEKDKALVEKRPQRLGKLKLLQDTNLEAVLSKKYPVDEDAPPVSTSGGQRLTSLARILMTLIHKGGANHLLASELALVTVKMAKAMPKDKKVYQDAWRTKLVGAAREYDISGTKPSAASLADILFFDGSDLIDGTIENKVKKIQFEAGKEKTAYLISVTGEANRDYVVATRWVNQEKKEFKIMSRLPITLLEIFDNPVKGPFLVILKLVLKEVPEYLKAEVAKKGCKFGGIIVEGGYAHPILDYAVPILVDSNTERQSGKVIVDILKKTGFTGTLSKPTWFSESNLDGYRPDFQVELGKKKGFIETMGYSDAAYRERKKQLVTALRAKFYFVLEHDCTSISGQTKNDITLEKELLSALNM